MTNVERLEKELATVQGLDGTITFRDAMKIALEHGAREFNSGYTAASEQASKAAEDILETTMKNWQDKYDYVGPFSEGRARVRLDWRYGHVDKNGKVTTPLVYDYVGYFSEGRAWVMLNGKWGHVDKNGKVTTPLVYDNVGDFFEGRAWVRLNGKWGHVDKQGRELE